MPVWPKSFYTFGVNLKSAATEWKLRHKLAASADQSRALATLLPRLAAASHWQAAGIEAGLTYEKFQRRVAPRTYEQLAPAIEQMKRGEADVLWPGRCSLFARSSGTTTGYAKMLPVTEEMLAHFRRATRESLLYYTVRARHAGMFRGRHLLLGSSTALVPVDGANPPTAFATELTGIVAIGLPTWVERHLYEPGATAAEISDWEERIDAIVARTCNCDVTLLAGLPNWALLLSRELRERGQNSGQPSARLQTLWPNLECLVHTGIPLTPFTDQLRQALGPKVRFHEVYAAAEGFVATQDTDAPAAGLRVMTDLGIFFEFIPAADFDEARIEQLGPKAVPLAGVKPGMDYAVLVTTPAGLVRTALGDVVRFVSTEPPRLIYVGRTALQLNVFTERVSEKEITDSLVAVCVRHDWTIVNFHVAPLLAKGGMTGQIRGCHEWWVELIPGTVTTPKGPQIGEAVDLELQRMNPDYAARRRSGVLGAPTVRLVMPGVFEHLLRHVGKWGGQHKLRRCSNDRGFADPLAQITNFARD